MGYIFWESEIGKVAYMDFAVALKPDGRVKEVILMVYRESIGGEIKNKRFMKQYRGKNYRSKIRLNRDIQGITGATLSSRAIAHGVKKAVCAWKIFYESSSS